MNNLAVLDTQELDQIEPSKADMIRNTFEPMVAMLEEFEDAYEKIVNATITDDITKQAKRLRLDIGKIRIEAEKVRKAQKEEYLRAGKAIDAVANILKWAVTDKEEKLKDIEMHFERLEAERLAKLQTERAEELAPFVEDAHERKLSDMDEDVWSAYLATKKQAYEDRIEAERKAEAERLERERIQQLEMNRRWEMQQFHQYAPPFGDLGTMSNDEYFALVETAKKNKAEAEAEAKRIREENEAIKAKLEAERAEAQKRAEAEAKARAKERAEAEAKIVAERKAREQAEAVERAKREELERQLAEKAAVEAKAAAAAKAAIEAEKQKGDADKMKDLISDLQVLKTKYSFDSELNKHKYSQVGALLDKIVNHITKTEN